jgi:hypothetical protein
VSLLSYVMSFFGAAPPLPAQPRRLDGRSATLLTASLKTLPEGAPGWITLKEAVTLFSPEGDAYACGETDEAGKANLAAFAAASGPVQFAFMLVEGRLYFTPQTGPLIGRLVQGCRAEVVPLILLRQSAKSPRQHKSRSASRQPRNPAKRRRFSWPIPARDRKP